MKVVQNLLNGVDPYYLDADSRFGKAFHLSENPDTTLAELAEYDNVGYQTVCYLFDKQFAKILDLIDPHIAEIWGYERGPITAFTKSVGFRARRAGFNVILFPSERGLGANLAVLNDFNVLLKPQMIVPSPELDPTYLDEEMRGISIFSRGN